MRKELLDFGVDAGVETIRFHLLERHQAVPSTSTTWRVLKARGFVTPLTHKRPKSSFTRFEADLPNECWYADMTHLELENGTLFEVLNMIADHSTPCGLSSHGALQVGFGSFTLDALRQRLGIGGSLGAGAKPVGSGRRPTGGGQ
jgi:hypothetical protein